MTGSKGKRASKGAARPKRGGEAYAIMPAPWTAAEVCQLNAAHDLSALVFAHPHNVASTLAALAQVDDREVARFTQGLEFAIAIWIEGSIDGAVISRSLTVFDQIAQHALALHDLIEQVGQEQPRDEVLRYVNLLLRDPDKTHKSLSRTVHGLPPFSAVREQLRMLHNAAVSARAWAAETIGTPSRRGRRRTDRYPSLHTLVYFLEHDAQLSGGRFTVDPKNCKGTMVQAIDVIREELAATDFNLASLLPLPGQHPVKMYERRIAEARADPRLPRNSQ